MNILGWHELAAPSNFSRGPRMRQRVLPHTLLIHTEKNSVFQNLKYCINPSSTYILLHSNYTVLKYCILNLNNNKKNTPFRERILRLILTCARSPTYQQHQHDGRGSRGGALDRRPRALHGRDISPGNIYYYFLFVYMIYDRWWSCSDAFKVTALHIFYGCIPLQDCGR